MDVLLEEMRERFFDEEKLVILHAELAEIKQTPTESIKSIIKRFDQRCRILDLEELLLLMYFKGAVRQACKTDLMLNSPVTLQKAYDRARLFSLTQKGQKASKPEINAIVENRGHDNAQNGSKNAPGEKLKKKLPNPS